MAKQDLSLLIERAKKTEMVNAPAQKVVPVKSKIKETPFNVHLPNDMLKNLKLLSVEKGTSIKKLIVSAIEEKYFSQ